MPRPLRYTLIGLLWAAVAGYIVYSAARVRTHRRQLVVQRLDIEIADSSSHGQLVTGGAVRQWLARSGVKTVGAAAREVDLRSIEGLILRNGFVADATASIDYGGVLRIAVRQRRPVVRLLFDGYNAYATDITQNVQDCLTNDTAYAMLANSEFVVMLRQTKDIDSVVELYGLSEPQRKYLLLAQPGEGIIKMGNSLIPFNNPQPKDTKTYKLLTTKPGEME